MDMCGPEVLSRVPKSQGTVTCSMEEACVRKASFRNKARIMMEDEMSPEVYRIQPCSVYAKSVLAVALGTTTTINGEKYKNCISHLYTICVLKSRFLKSKVQ